MAPCPKILTIHLQKNSEQAKTCLKLPNHKPLSVCFYSPVKKKYSVSPESPNLSMKITKFENNIIIPHG
jgi:hypothetical protein